MIYRLRLLFISLGANWCLMDELFDAVDDDDVVIGQVSRKEAHTRGHIHRSVLFFIFGPGGRVFVNQRTYDKDFYPGCWSIVFGGHVHAGEKYEDTVVREAEEETGVTAKPFLMASFRKRFDTADRENVRVYGFIANGELRLDPGEVLRGAFMTMDELERKLGQEKFLPETSRLLEVLKDYLRDMPQGPCK
jgi:isopentenyldiphosphate isomerase